MTSVSVAGYTISGLDNAAGVQSAAQAYQNNPSNATLIAYQAALASAAAAATSLIQGEGAAFAGNSIVASVTNIITNGASMSANDLASAFASIAGNIATMAGQGVEFLGLAGSSVNPIFGGGAFTLGELINAVGFIASATGVGIDSSTIANVISQNLQSAGLSPDSNGSYTPASLSGSNFVCDSSNAATMWNIVQENNTDQISATQQSGSNVATVISTGGNDDIIISPGVADSELNLISSGGNSTITGVNSGSTSGGNITVNGNQNSTSISNGSVNIGASSSDQVNGSNNSITEAAGAYLVANGGNNTIDTVAGAQAYITGTGSNLDAVYANGDQLGGTTSNGQPTGILFNTNAAAEIFGSNNGIREAAGDYRDSGQGVQPVSRPVDRRGQAYPSQCRRRPGPI